MEEMVLSFEKADAKRVDKLGAKGAKLIEDFQMIQKNFPQSHGAVQVPDGFVITTDVCREYFAKGRVLSDEHWRIILKALVELENRLSRRFGMATEGFPLLVAVRGGAPVSLPGAVSTVLNVGLNDEIVKSLISQGDDPVFILSTYLNGIRMYGEVVLGIPYDEFYRVLEQWNVRDEADVDKEEVLCKLVGEYRKILNSVEHPKYGTGFPQEPSIQLRNAVEAVFDSWMGLTAIEARKSRKPPVSDDMGTAVVIQSMVFGNRSKKSLSGVLFTRDQRTGENKPVIEWAPRIQCDKIVSGRLRKRLQKTEDLKAAVPEIYELLLMVRDRLETRSKRPLDVEFTVEDNVLYILQRRPLRMTFNATVRALWDMVDEGKTTIQLASLIINNALEQPEKVVRENFEDYELIGKGEPITDSADTGILVFGTEQALELARKGVKVILLRKRPYGETDIAVNHPNVRGIIRYDGNATGHEAVSAVAYSKPYLINVVDAKGEKPVVVRGNRIELNSHSLFARYIGKRVFVDGERGIVGFTEKKEFLEDRRSRKKLYVDWEYVRKRFEKEKYETLSYEQLLDIHYQWELELERYQQLEKRIKQKDATLKNEELLQAFEHYLNFVSPKDVKRVLALKEVNINDFEFSPVLVYRGNDLAAEVSKIIKTLMLCITWRTHWVHQILVEKAKARGETENDVIRDIFLKNRTMSLVHGFEKEGFHVMKVPGYHYLIFASNFEYDQDLNRVQIGPATLDYREKEILARHFLAYLKQTNPELGKRVRLVQGEPPLGQGHARIISVGLSVANDLFPILCRYLRAFLDQCRDGCSLCRDELIPSTEFIELYRLDPFFALYPDMKIKKNEGGTCFITFGNCSYGEFDGTVFGEKEYMELVQLVKTFEWHLKVTGRYLPIRPWSFEVDPFRRHSVITAVGISCPVDRLNPLLEALKEFLGQRERETLAEPCFRSSFERMGDDS
ncbi:MAG TPA: hypothetical protein ENG14_00380 [Thermodesulforhabdus norvegica]|uniref:Pyruvate phosphate dikinase AMP/ATP-binding domain-containing protein n=1 Tax=Thermodesulforhabdus norvegica TaxID=39841 RepID=A0A7C0WR38_9BACT|nr:hypothetical protein [Deltaproteobacteria bacterium]MBW2068989.1 hypothetical protein [Deltaproteobacteria bacterium]HDL89344.1 hypothetical protein [Thermodesulforhabdus norvegica]